MDAVASPETKPTGATEKSFGISAPSLSLPKGGGAIKGIGEKFTSNPVTGTGSMTIPLPASPGRAGFGPQLALSYDSGAGNGPFGLGWHLPLPSITRKTDKGLPQYFDARDSDVFILSGAEDLVPVLVKNAAGVWIEESVPNGRLGPDEFRLRRYRPRIEGLFARIERWTNTKNATDVRWRSISKDNITTWYGGDPASRIADPADPAHIFSWLICRTHDDRGNVMSYSYAPENDRNIDPSHSLAHESNRPATGRTANRYLRSVRYGNRTPYFPNPLSGTSVPLPADADWMFSVVFDYGEAGYLSRSQPADDPQLVNAPFNPTTPIITWPVRQDPFSSYRSGFEVRTYRLCQRVLMFHHFTAELNTAACLVRSTEFNYTEEPVASFVTSVVQSGYLRQSEGIYQKRSLPPLEFGYSRAEISAEIREVDPASLENLPAGLDGSGYQWVDLDGEGLTGILAQQNGAWYYKRNLSALPQPDGAGDLETRACFAPVECVARVPASAFAPGGQHQFLDLAGDGNLDVVEFGGLTPGFYERTTESGWKPRKPFRFLPNLAWDDPNLRFIDLTGDGFADILITEDNVFTYYRSLAEDGFAAAERVYQSFDENAGPRLVQADATTGIFTADMTGDGLADLVRVRNGEVVFFPNLGRAKFGTKITLDNSPWFDRPDQFDPKRLRLADIDGSGTTDLIYLGRNRIAIYRNLAGNRFADAEPLDQFPSVDNHTAVQVCDLLGNGTACLVWSSPLSADSQRPMRYIDLVGGQKPHLLTTVRNNLGAETIIQYAPSTKFYLADKFAGRPWITKLPFPVHCVEKTIVTDQWRKTTLSSTYSYHHGYFDGVEREFRGFGRVEQIDTESYRAFAAANEGSVHVTPDQALYQAPVKTITWFHTGAALDRHRILRQFASEYFTARYPLPATFSERALPEPELDPHLSDDDWREALRACKGMVLRQESYELQADALTPETPKDVPVRLFSAATHNCQIRCLQPTGDNRHAVFLVTESEALSYQYELDLRITPPAPDPRITHTLNLRRDEYGNPQQSMVVAYGRLAPGDYAGLPRPELIDAVQAETHVAYSETRYTKDVLLPEAQPIMGQIEPIKHHRLRLPCEVLTFELKGIKKTDALYYALADFRKLDLSEKYGHGVGETPPSIHVARKEYHEYADGSVEQKRIVEHARTLFFKDEDGIAQPNAPHDLGQHGPRGLKYEDYKLALTDALLTAIFTDGQLAKALPTGATVQAALNDWKISGYLSDPAASTQFGLSAAGEYWMRSGIAGFATEADQHFYLPVNYTDAFNNPTTLAYGPFDLFVQSTRDALGNISGVLVDPTTAKARFDYRVLAPLEMVDPNGNHSEVCFDVLGFVVAAAVKGKRVGGHWEGDHLDDFTDAITNPPSADVVAFCTSNTLDSSKARDWLASATSRFVYHFGNENGLWVQRMAGACGIARERHLGQLAAGEESLLQISLEYSDGTGQVLMKKAQAEPDPVSKATPPTLRWIINGLTVLNNKGKPVKQYEPAFSDNFGPEFPQANGVTPVMYYDAAGRLVRTEMPDGTLSRVEFSPWHLKTYDANDTVGESQWYQDRGAPAATDPEPADPDTRSAWLAVQHADTPSLTILDSLDREVIAIAHNRTPDAGGVWRDAYFITFTKLDAEGKPLWIRDARGNLVMQYVTPPKPTRLTDQPNEDIPSRTGPAGKSIYSAPCYDIAGNLLFQHSMDAGDRWMINDAGGKPMAAWDFNEREEATGRSEENRLYFTEHDALHRPTAHWLRIWDRPTPPAPGTTAQAYIAHAGEMVERFEYQDGPATDPDNLNGELIRHYDPSGMKETVRRDFKGNVLEVVRRLNNQPTESSIDWQGDPHTLVTKLETDIFRQITAYDALNRMTLHYNWHRAPNSVAAYVPAYNQRGALKSENLLVRASRTAAGPTGGVNAGKPDAIEEIRYNAKGQKEYLQLGNGTITRYTYDEETFRLTHLFTKRVPIDSHNTRFDKDCANNSADDPRPKRPCGLQNLHYTYDPTGNLTHIQDDAQQTIFFDSAKVEPSNDYVYDAVYRLISATGRETARGSDAARDGTDAVYQPDFPITDKTVRNYTENYVYDSVGNFVTFEHAIQNDSKNSWTRQYAYAFDNSTQPASNRLWQTWTGNTRSTATTYAHDTHGNMLNLANTAPRFHLRWDHRDMIRNLDLGGGGRAYYQYDSGKQRTRKIIARNPPDVSSHTIKEERIYLDGYELYRRYTGDPNDPIEEIESHHLFEGEQRLLLVDDVLRTRAPRPDGLTVTAQTLFRYQYSNHLGSACLELDYQAKVISYEDYHPYGTSAYRAVNERTHAPPKRYRYTRMERDEESGLGYHGTRYQIAWLGRWASIDSAPLVDGVNTYEYTRNSPLGGTDRNGRATRKQGKPDDVNLHGSQGKRGKKNPITKKYELESEHIQGIANDREELRNPATGKSPIPEGRGHAFDRKSPTALLDKELSDAKTPLDADHLRKLRSGQPVTQTGEEGAMARLKAAAKSTGKPVTPGAEVANIGQTDAKHADPNVRRFSRAPKNQPLTQATEAEIEHAVESHPVTGQRYRISVPDDPKAKTLFKGKYTREEQQPKSTQEPEEHAQKPRAPGQVLEEYKDTAQVASQAATEGTAALAPALQEAGRNAVKALNPGQEPPPPGGPKQAPKNDHWYNFLPGFSDSAPDAGTLKEADKKGIDNFHNYVQF